MVDDTVLHILRQRPATTARAIVNACLDADSPAARSLYIHIPFCFHKCHYCDFYSFVDTKDRQPAFVGRLCEELRALAPVARGLPLETVFVGGGTPTLLPPELWRQLLTCLEETFDLSMIHAGTGEFTVECNPETAHRELFDVLVAGGVSRLSVGAQSFNTQHLKTLERWHDPASVGRAIELARASGIARRSVDLIYAIPRQTLAELVDDLDQALALPIDHLSAYNLTYEPNTAMTVRRDRGEFEDADEDTELEMFWLVRERCRAAALDAYEVSNFAVPGAECRHNLAYWKQLPWMAAGPSASAHVGGHRYKIVPRLADYLETSEDGFPLVTDHEPPDGARALSEVLMTGIRLGEGLQIDAVLRSASTLRCEDALKAEIGRVRAEGWLLPDASRLILSETGLPLADHVASCLMSVVD